MHLVSDVISNVNVLSQGHTVIQKEKKKQNNARPEVLYKDHITIGLFITLAAGELLIITLMWSVSCARPEALY